VFFRKSISTDNKRFILEIKALISKINRLLSVEINENLYFYNAFLRKKKKMRNGLKFLKWVKLFYLKLFILLEILKENPANLNRLVLFKFFKNEFCKLKKHIFFFKKIVFFNFLIKKLKKTKRRKFIGHLKQLNLSKVLRQAKAYLNYSNDHIARGKTFLKVLQNSFLFFYFFKLMSEQ
jgi:hypothetical protein